MIKFYDKIPDMECLQGDTLPSFIISAEADELTDCRMQCIIAAWDEPEKAVFTKECTATDDGFAVILNSEDIENLKGLFHMHFRFIGANGLSYRKLSGTLHILPAPKGE